MTRLVLGVIGHVDHGKTALVRALTGADTDRLKEEKERGISIALGFAHLKVGENVSIDLIDMPGHERFVRTMISGATGIDAVLLVLAANEGIKPQTIEHVAIASLLGLRRAIIAISKADLVESEQAQAIAAQASQLLSRHGFEFAPPILTSALQERGIDDLRHGLAALVASQQPHAANGVAFLPIDRAFSIAGHGPVVTGTLRGAPIATGDTLELAPTRQRVRIKAVQVHGERVASAAPGQRVALNLRDVELADLKRSASLAAPDTLTLSSWLTLSIRAVEGAPPLRNGMRLRALLGAEEIDVRLRLLDRDVLEANENAFAQLRCAEPIAAPAREHVILRLASPARTVAGGRILEPQAPRHRRNSPSILKRLENLRAMPPAALIAAEVEQAGRRGTTLTHLSRLSALSLTHVATLLQPLAVVVTHAGDVMRAADLDELIARVPPLLASQPAGLSHENLTAALHEPGVALLDEALARLLARGAIGKRGGQFLIPRPDEDRARARNEAALTVQIAETLRASGLAPPTPNEIIVDAQAQRAVDRLLREGVIVRAVDRAKNKEILFHQDAIEEAQRRLAPLLERVPGLLATEVGAALGISRKYTMPLLDHLDTIRFTRRIKDRRILGPKSPSVR